MSTAPGIQHQSVLANQEEPSRLHGRWRQIAQGLWGFVLLISLTRYALATPLFFAKLQKACISGEDCLIPIDATVVRALEAAGVSLSLIAGYYWSISTLVLLVCCGIAAMILWRGSGERMALITAFFLVMFGSAINSVGSALDLRSPQWAAIGTLFGATAILSFVLFFFTFPTGRIERRWIQLLTAVAMIWAVGNVLGWMPRWAIDIGFLALLVSCLAVQVFRFRSTSTSIQRQQTKWVVYGTIIMIVAWVLLALPPSWPSTSSQFDSMYSFFVSIHIGFVILLLPFSIGVAVLYARLWDVDIIIRKTLVYTTLTALLAVVYFGTVILLQRLFGVLAGVEQSPLALVLSTLVIAALFTPLRRRTQDAIDRRFFRKKYNAQQVLARFALTARDETDLDALLAELVSVVDQTLQPEHVSVWLRKPESMKASDAPRRLG